MYVYGNSSALSRLVSALPTSAVRRNMAFRRMSAQHFQPQLHRSKSRKSFDDMPAPTIIPARPTITKVENVHIPRLSHTSGPKRYHPSDHTFMEGGPRRIHGDINTPPSVKCMCGVTTDVRRLKYHLVTKVHFKGLVAAFRARHSTPENDDSLSVQKEAITRQMDLATVIRRKQAKKNL